MQEAGGVTGPGLEVAGWSVDSRTLAAGDLYFALRGPSHDGHDYVGEATRKGAAGVVVDHAIDGVQNALIVADMLGRSPSLGGLCRPTWRRAVCEVCRSARESRL